jgi:hypothetical protein
MKERLRTSNSLVLPSSPTFKTHSKEIKGVSSVAAPTSPKFKRSCIQVKNSHLIFGVASNIHQFFQFFQLSDLFGIRMHRFSGKELG